MRLQTLRIRLVSEPIWQACHAIIGSCDGQTTAERSVRSTEEQREIIIGHSVKDRLLLVYFTAQQDLQRAKGHEARAEGL